METAIMPASGQPTDSKDIFEQSATIESWDHDYYHPIAEHFYDNAIPDMLRLMDVRTGTVVLDGGTGPGVHAIRTAKQGFDVVAIDISESMLQAASQRVARAGVSNRVKFQQEDLTNLSFPDGKFEKVFSWGVIIHIPQVEKALDELARVVARGGKLSLYVTNQSSLDEKIEALARFLLGKPHKERSYFPLGQGTWYEMHGERLWVWQFNIPELVRQMEHRGLRLLHRRAGEFSEIQRRVPRLLRVPLLHMNNLYYRAGFPASIATANLLVFEKL
jgi:SAM-dependent methyltransferase